jgi:hypothetical protein
VKKDDLIKPSEYIGNSGAVGSPGSPHLHVEYRKGREKASWYFASEHETGNNINPIEAIAVKRNAISTKNNGSSTYQVLKGNLALNAYAPKKYSKVNLWKKSAIDLDQHWIIVRDQISRAGTNYCLNTPDRKGSGRVFMWPCDEADPDKKWIIYSLGRDKMQVRLKNTGFCLNAYKPRHRSKINIYKCDSRDADQYFTIKKLTF